MTGQPVRRRPPARAATGPRRGTTAAPAARAAVAAAAATRRHGARRRVHHLLRAQRRQGRPWGHDIPAYLFLGGLAGGSSLLGAGADLTGRPALRRTGRYAALASRRARRHRAGHDLGRPERALNMLRVVKPTSPMSVGTWILTAYGPFAGLAAAAEAGRRCCRSGPGLRPLLRVADPVGRSGPRRSRCPLAAYTAVLLTDTATPTWHEAYRELPFVFVGLGQRRRRAGSPCSPRRSTRPARRAGWPSSARRSSSARAGARAADAPGRRRDAPRGAARPDAQGGQAPDRRRSARRHRCSVAAARAPG